MFYMLIAIILVLFYLFIAPKHIKGTLNLVALTFLSVAVAMLLIVGFLKISQTSLDIWVVVAMTVVGLWALYDLYRLDKSDMKHIKRKPYRYR